MKSLGAAVILLWMGLGVVTAESVSIEHGHESLTQKICQPDIHAVLREMSAKIAEQQAELRHNKEQLQAVEKRAEAVGTGLRAELQDVETRLRASEKTVEEQKLVIKDLTEKQNEQAAGLGEVRGSLTLTGIQVEELRRDREASRVSFSAALGDGYYGPFDVATPLVFKTVFTNVGSAYNVNTGVFTAPVRGVYHFVLFVFGDASATTWTGASLHHNGKHVVIAYDAQVNSHHVKPANGASLLLEVGDVVQVKLSSNSWVRDTRYRHTTFSGH
ncbi:cerebellin-2-like [Engraulis encrasicolus]|uniref:cerebellin-2-like n=1 Tax=Engraulis encrasicolus TaxID=184585 RepID=UPI002FCF61B4